MERVLVGKLASLRDREMRMVRVGRKEVLVVKVDDRVYAMDGWCSHMGAPLDGGQLVDQAVRCRAHGAVFDLATGKVLRGGNMAKDLKTYPVVVEGEDVYLEYEGA